MVKIKATIVEVKRCKDGEWTLKLSIPASDAVKAAAVASQSETVFSVEFTPDENGQ